MRVTDPLVSEPRPSAKQRVEIEQITVPSSKPKPGPKPSKGRYMHDISVVCAVQ